MSNVIPFSPQIRAYDVTKCQKYQLIPLDKEHLIKIQKGLVRTLYWDERNENSTTLGIWGEGDLVIVVNPLQFSGNIAIESYAIECLTDIEFTCIPSRCRHLELPAILRRLEEIEALLQIMHCPCLEDRLYQFLMWMAYKFGHQVDDGLLIDFRISHHILADAISSTRVTITRLLGQMEQKGLIYRRRHRLILRSAKGSLSKEEDWEYDM
jgi:hypothetical protein